MSLGAKHGKFGVQLGPPTVEQMQMFDKRMQEVLLYLRWQEVSTEIPPLSRERLPIAMTPKEKREYNSLLGDIRRVLGQRVRYGDVVKASAMLQVGALWRFVGRVKVRHVVDLACSTSEQVVIWTWHKDVARDISEFISKRENVQVGVITGDESHKKRDETLARFQSGSIRVLVCTIAVAGVGIDLTTARLSIFGEMCWTPSDLAQCEGRVWRTGQQRNCVTYWPVVEGTIEDHMLDVLLRKEYYAQSGVFGGLEVMHPVADLDSEMIDLLDLAVGDLA